MYEAGYNKLFWGMIFIIFDFNLGGINLLPDFIGYFLIYAGLIPLQQQHEFYKKAKAPLIILLSISLVKAISYFTTGYIVNQKENINLFSLLIGSFTSLVTVYLIYILCRSIYLLASSRGEEELKSNAEYRFKYYSITVIALVLYLPFSINLSQDMSMIGAVIILLNIIFTLPIVGLFRKAMNVLGDGKV
ncbi:hypothetical protein JK636_16345 [Clostridium sp. YIM B02515]|uniref:Uncharacterized protein n=1 Tax=Clostridium rhizosphaerae TaxID=2803861 RepID=A0ABS1TDC2_9CLOT|nr:hypothetical protein [Clostridium rhizosphaerae]MBL4937300.1 hypothetical protein [Clostridium rhizosphaerae]